MQFYFVKTALEKSQFFAINRNFQLQYSPEIFNSNAVDYYGIIKQLDALIHSKSDAETVRDLTTVTETGAAATQLIAQVAANGDVTYITDKSGLSPVNVFINGVNYGDSFPTNIGGSAFGADATYPVTTIVDVTYAAPAYAVSYHDVTVTGDQSGTLKLMKVTIDGTTPTYAYYIAADNTFNLHVGTKINTYESLQAYVASLNTADAPTAATTAGYDVTSEVTVPVANDPQGRSLTLTKTINNGTTTWTCTDTYDMTGTKLTFSNGTTTTDYTAINEISFVSDVTPTVTYVATT